jgi:Tfp pilus assembly protein PilW
MASRIRSDQSGFTLIELIVSALLTVVVLGIVTGIFLSLSSTSTSVRSVTTATTAGQAAANSIERAARNSSSMTASSPVTGDYLLKARTLGSGSTALWTCAYWYYSAADKTIRYKSSSVAITALTYAAQKSWSLLSDGVSPMTSTTDVFSVPAAASPQTLILSFKESAGKSAPVVFTSSSSNQAFTDTYGGPASC